MGKVWQGRSFDEDWHEDFGNGVRSDTKDWQANAEYAAANNTQNPYTNEAGASEYDKSGLIPGNEPGSTLPRVTGPTRKSAATATPYMGASANYQPTYYGTQTPIQSQLGTPVPFGTPVSASSYTPTPVPAAPPVNRVSAESGPRRISDTLVTQDSFGGEPMGGEDALARLAELLQGVLR